MDKENKLVEAINSTNYLYCKTGRRNAYRKAFLDGQGASRKEATWNEEKHYHTCCGSKVAWRHKIDCKREELEGNKKWKDLEREEKKWLKERALKNY